MKIKFAQIGNNLCQCHQFDMQYKFDHQRRSEKVVFRNVVNFTFNVYWLLVKRFKKQELGGCKFYCSCENRSSTDIFFKQDLLSSM